MPDRVPGAGAARKRDLLMRTQSPVDRPPHPHKIETEVGRHDRAVRKIAGLVRAGGARRGHLTRLFGRRPEHLSADGVDVRLGVVRIGCGRRTTRVGRAALRVERHPHHRAVAPAGGEQAAAVGGDRDVTRRCTGRNRGAERHERGFTGAGVGLHGAGLLQRGVDHVAGGMRREPRRRVGRDHVAAEPEGAVDVGRVGRSGVQHPDAGGLAAHVGGVAAREEPHAASRQTRSCRTTTASRAGPTPITEMRVPLIPSSAST